MVTEVSKYTSGAAAGGAGSFVNLDPLRDALRVPHRFPAAWMAVQHVENHDLVDGDHEAHEIEPRIRQHRGHVAHENDGVIDGANMSERRCGVRHEGHPK